MFGGDPREMRRYMALAQVGWEMVAPIGIGLLIDYFFGWLPWATVVCSVLGFVGGMVHLVLLAQKSNADERKPPEGGAK
jgi:F0F1-type ATP synthase assembly protein I